MCDVGYVVDFKTNLLSVSRMTNAGCVVSYRQNDASVIKNKNVLFKIPLVLGLYVYSSVITNNSSTLTNTAYAIDDQLNNSNNTDENDDATTVTNTINNNNNNKIKQEMRMLHVKYGHVAYTQLQKLINNNSVDGMKKMISNEKVLNSNILKELLVEKCVGCLEGKFIRLPMTGVVNYHVSEILDMFV